jgi:putative endonuclease
MRACAYQVQILSSLSRTLYTGVINNLFRRVHEHRESKPDSLTARYRVTRLFDFEVFRQIASSIARETEIKDMTRTRKIELIKAMNSDWKDLLEE